MGDAPAITPAPAAPAKPKIGMVSLGCPKALVDSERILTRLKGEGYETSADYAGSDAVGRQHLRLPGQRARGEPGGHRGGSALRPPR